MWEEGREGEGVDMGPGGACGPMNGNSRRLI